PMVLASPVRALRHLPAGAVDRLWVVLGPSLAEPPPPQIQARLDMFRERYQLAPQTLSDALIGLRRLFRRAAEVRLKVEIFEDDLRTLQVEEAHIQALMGGYGNAMTQLHREITLRTIGDHGSVIVDISWRLDKLLRSARGDSIEEPVATLTFTYTTGYDKTERITLQALPAELEKMRNICRLILGAD
ncbi:MAG: COMM domain-containing protein, partial [Myxococcota bacterium]